MNRDHTSNSLRTTRHPRAFNLRAPGRALCLSERTRRAALASGRRAFRSDVRRRVRLFDLNPAAYVADRRVFVMPEEPAWMG